MENKFLKNQQIVEMLNSLSNNEKKNSLISENVSFICILLNHMIINY